MAICSPNNPGTCNTAIPATPKMKPTIQPMAKYDTNPAKTTTPPTTLAADYNKPRMPEIESADVDLDTDSTVDTSLDMGSDVSNDMINDTDNELDDLNKSEVTQEGALLTTGIIVLSIPLAIIGFTAGMIAVTGHREHKNDKKFFKELSAATHRKVTVKDEGPMLEKASHYFNDYLSSISYDTKMNKEFVHVDSNLRNAQFATVSDPYTKSLSETNEFIVAMVGVTSGLIKKSNIEKFKKTITSLSNDTFKFSASITSDENLEYKTDDDRWFMMLEMMHNAKLISDEEFNKYDTEFHDNEIISSKPDWFDKYSIVSVVIVMSTETFLNMYFNQVTQEAVEKIIKTAPDMMTALESVGAMYCIPSTNMICDNSLKSIKVVGDCVNAPNVKNVSGNGKAIMCAIGAVLDNISQRIDDKIDAYHNANVMNGVKSEIEILDDLNKPHIKNPDEPVKNTYFNDMDDITKDLDLNVVDDTISDNNTVDIASEIKESYDLVEMYSNHGCTRNLGYEILQEQGFDYIKPSESTEIVLEAASSDKSKLSATDIKYAKFDNKNIINAIKYFNEAREDQKVNEAGQLNFHAFINHPSYKKAVACLSKQFDANIQFRLFDDKNPYDESEYTIIFDDVKSNISVSKAKGFQLNGMPIIINIIGNAIDSDAPDDISMFGQSMVSAALHEIFHNIAGAFASTSNEFNASLDTTLAIASSISSGRKRRIFLTNYANTLDNFFGLKMTRRNKRVFVKQLSVMVSVMYNNKALDDIRKSISASTDEHDIDTLINVYERIVKNELKKRSSKAGIIGLAAVAITSFLASMIFKSKIGRVNNVLLKLNACMFGMISGFSLLNQVSLKNIDKSYKDSHEMEEYYCDLFAGMYNLPVTFMYRYYPNGKRGITTNQLSDEHFKKLIKLEREIYQMRYSSYPTISERNHAAVKIAKNTLENDKSVDPSIKKYLQWIVDNYSSTLDSDIDEIYNTTTFDPKEAEDLDKHLDNLITSNNITLTESFIKYINTDDNCIND